MKKTKSNEPIHPKTVVGHVHLKVADLERSVKFYTKVLGFKVMTRYGVQAAFLSADSYHHHIGLNTWESLGGKQPPQGSTGLYHFAILVPNRKELAKMFKKLMDHNYPIEGASDHGVSEAIYLKDPDGNGIEIYADRPRKKWKYDSKGNLIMCTKRIDIEDLMKELEK
ncbi:VOC family protein [Candidatus Woesearchaeota archaeon]|nr:VOC family protein [Candidatus Woesearchaeota archaeon]